MTAKFALWIPASRVTYDTANFTLEAAPSGVYRAVPSPVRGSALIPVGRGFSSPPPLRFRAPLAPPLGGGGGPAFARWRPRPAPPLWPSGGRPLGEWVCAQRRSGGCLPVRDQPSFLSGAALEFPDLSPRCAPGHTPEPRLSGRLAAGGGPALRACGAPGTARLPWWSCRRPGRAGDFNESPARRVPARTPRRRRRSSGSGRP